MLTKDEAERIAGAVSALRPDWSINGIMSILADGRCRNRAKSDLTLAFIALALDPASRKPTRIYEHGPWWEITAPRVGSTVEYRRITDGDCGICLRPYELHSALSPTDPHTWEPQHARAKGQGPTPEQRAAIDTANAEARQQATAAKEAAEERRQPKPVDEVLAAHQSTEGTHIPLAASVADERKEDR